MKKNLSAVSETDHNAKIQKTNAVRILDQAKIPYILTPYEVDESDLSAVHAAETSGINIDQIFKTLILKGDKTGYLVCVIPGGSTLDLKKAAKASGNKNCAMIAMKDLQPLTGYMRGGCSPIGMKKHFPTFVDASALQWPHIHVSAGQRGLQMQLASADLVKVTEALVCELSAA